MATYRNTFNVKPIKAQKQKYFVLEKVVDLSNVPTGASEPRIKYNAGDVLQVINIRSGQVVLGVLFELLTRSTDSGDSVDIGYGSDADRWGRYNLSDTVGFKSAITDKAARANFGEPLHFASADTLDVVINKAAAAGRFKLYVHVLEKE